MTDQNPFRSAVESSKSDRDPVDILKSGCKLIEQKKYEESIHDFDILITNFLNQSEQYKSKFAVLIIKALYHKSESLEELKRFDDAKEAINTAIDICMSEIEKHPNDADKKKDLASCLISIKQYEAAHEVFDQAINKEEINADYWFGKAYSLTKLGKYQESIDAFEVAIKFYRTRNDKIDALASAWVNKGFAHHELGKIQDSINCYNKALEIDPEHDIAWFNIGQAYLSQNEYDAAVLAFNTVIEINSNDSEAWNNLGVSLSKLGRFEEAINALSTSINKKQNQILARCNLANLFFDLCNDTEAYKNITDGINILKSKQKLSKVEGEAYVTLLSLKAQIYIDRHDFSKAQENLQEANTMNAGNLLIILWYAYVTYIIAEYRSTSNFEEKILPVIRMLEKVNGLCNNDVEKDIRAYVLYFLGFLYFKINALYNAKNCLKECIKLKSPKSNYGEDLLRYIWTYQIKPPFWRWWLDSPIKKGLKRLVFILTIIPLLFFLVLLILHPFIPNVLCFASEDWCSSIAIDWNIYIFISLVLIFFIIFPNITRIKTKDFEIEMHAPPTPEFSALIFPPHK